VPPQRLDHQQLVGGLQPRNEARRRGREDIIEGPPPVPPLRAGPGEALRHGRGQPRGLQQPEGVARGRLSGDVAVGAADGEDVRQGAAVRICLRGAAASMLPMTAIERALAMGSAETCRRKLRVVKMCHDAIAMIAIRSS
jgi:hypothetical protein